MEQGLDDYRWDVPLTRQGLLQGLERMGIATTTVEHRATFTVAESSDIDRSLPGAHTKNLFLKDAKGRLLLIVANVASAVDLNGVAKRLGMGRVSFGRPELLMEVLGVAPGSVTVFAIANDREMRVQLVVDETLMAYDSLNCHPLENTATTNIARDDLLRFIRATGHEPKIMALAG